MSETVNTHSPLYSSRPTIRINGQASPELDADLLDLVIDESVNNVSCCKAIFNNHGQTSGQDVGYLYFDRTRLDFGYHLEVLLEKQTLFSGHIVAMEGVYLEGAPPQIRVVAEDRLRDLRTTRRTRHFQEASEADVIQTIAGEYGMQTNIQSNALSRIQQEIIQLDQTDLEFLSQRCVRVGAEFWVDGELLYVYDREARNGNTLNLTYGQQLKSFAVQANLANQVTELSVSGWNVSAKMAIAHTVDRQILANEVNGRTGSRFLLDVFGERPQHLAKEGPVDDTQARDFAEAAFRANARHFVTGKGVANTHPDLRVGTTVILDELGELFNGDYYIAGVQHHFYTTEGFQTEFVVERADLLVPDLEQPRRPPPKPKPKTKPKTKPKAKPKSKLGSKKSLDDIKSIR